MLTNVTLIKMGVLWLSHLILRKALGSSTKYVRSEEERGGPAKSVLACMGGGGRFSI